MNIVSIRRSASITTAYSLGISLEVSASRGNLTLTIATLTGASPAFDITRTVQINVCTLDRWPSIRADDVINERFFEGSEISEKDFIDKVLPHRLPWTRGLRFSVEGKHRRYGSVVALLVSTKSMLETRDYYPGSTDMVKYWPRLGFTVKHPNKKIKRQNREGSNPVWLETEREKIVRKDKTTQLPFQVQLEESDDRQGL